MTAPLIGITTSRTVAGSTSTVSLPGAYVQAVAAAGGVPVLLPPGMQVPALAGLRSRLDGILLSGGADVEPSLFGGQQHPRVYGVDPGRDALEIELVHIAAQTGWPLLAICRGVQVLNVALGGTLFTHIEEQLLRPLKHDNGDDHPRDYLAHPVTVERGSRLGSILGAGEVWVNSMHHQGIEHIAPGLCPSSLSPDGLVEAVELPEHPFAIGVQWHPECMPDSGQMQALFQSFVAAAEAVRSEG